MTGAFRLGGRYAELVVSLRPSSRSLRQIDSIGPATLAAPAIAPA
jgi:hypothetical protein